MSYTLKQMSGEEAKGHLARMLSRLSDIEAEDMTTFELLLLHAVAENPPALRVGQESQINNGVRR